MEVIVVYCENLISALCGKNVAGGTRSNILGFHSDYNKSCCGEALGSRFGIPLGETPSHESKPRFKNAAKCLVPYFRLILYQNRLQGPATRKSMMKFCSKRTPWKKGIPKSSVSDQENLRLVWNTSGYTTVCHQPSLESAESSQRPQSVLMLSFD